LFDYSETIRKIESKLGRTTLLDRYSIRKEIRRIKRSREFGEKIEKRLQRLEVRLQTAIKKRSVRQAKRPVPEFDFELPILEKKNEIIDAIKRHRVLIVSGVTGSGKSTQLPKFCLAAGRGINGLIGCTQPRRIAAMTVSRRIAEELGEELGQSVGYKIRFQDRTRSSSYIKIMTDGMLLAETQSDPNLYHYDTLIVDEAHERILNIDFLLGILEGLIRRRKDLRLIITSATIDTEKFSKAFHNAPVIEVSGRMYPVDVKYISPDAEESDQTHVEQAAETAHRLLTETAHGDMLVFMPTEQDIRETCELLEGKKHGDVVVFPLFARLSASDQSKIFKAIPKRKIIVATNVAETSITIPGIKYVIDTGLARISQYSPGTRTTSLPVTDISQSSAEQRKGRCGRVEHGVCVRLFSEEAFDTRPVYTSPEILRSNLAEVILRMLALNLGDISDFPFIDPPAQRSIKDGFDLLMEIGAIKMRENRSRWDKQSVYMLTDRGKLMSRMPIDPRLSRMLIQAKHEGCSKEMVVIAAALSIQDPRERPSDRIQEADEMHRVFHHEASDFLSLLNIWNRYHEIFQKEKTTGSLKRFCRNHFLSFRRMREWLDIHGQLWAIIEEAGFLDNRDQGHKRTLKLKSKEDDFDPEYTAIHRSILSGFLSNIAQKKESNFFRAGKNREAMIFPGSALFNRAKQWVIAAEMVETSRLFARCVANIDSEWIEDIGRNRLKYTYQNPRWSKKRGAVIASEQVSLYGLIIATDRPVNYGPIDPEKASDIFIREALVAHNTKENFPFLDHNKTLIEEITDIEERFRRRDILVNEEDMVEFYKDRLPLIYDIRGLRKVIKKNGNDHFLKMTKAFLLQYDPDQEEIHLYPDTVQLGKNRYLCDYRFDPGKADDGVTVKIPLTSASTVPVESIDWIVPGLFKEKVESMIKVLPKRYRKQLVPVTSAAEIIAGEMPKTEEPLPTALSRFILRRFTIDIPASAWLTEDIPDHLRIRLSLTDPKGKELLSGREKNLLYRESKVGDQDEYKAATRKWERKGITRWDFEELPEIVHVKGDDRVVWTYFPGLKNDQDSVSIKLFRRKDKALSSHLSGVGALLSIHFSKDLKFLRKALSISGESLTHSKYFGGVKAIEKQLYDRVIEELFHLNIRNRDEFNTHADKVKPLILEAGRVKKDRVVSVMRAYHETLTGFRQLELNNVDNPRALSFLSHLRDEMNRLIPKNFISLYNTDRLQHLIRYLKAVSLRAERGLVDFERDQSKAEQVRDYTQQLNDLLEGLSIETSKDKRDEIEAFFWLIEEYKVSLFAQEIKTPIPISKKRLDKKLREIERMV